MIHEARAALARGNLNLFKAAPGSLRYVEDLYYDGQLDDSAKCVIVELYKFFSTHPDANPENCQTLKDRFIDLTILLKKPFPTGPIKNKELNKLMESIPFSLDQIRLAESLIKNHPHVIQIPSVATRDEEGCYVARRGAIAANTEIQVPCSEDFQKLQSLKAQASIGQYVTALFLNSHAVERFRKVATNVETIVQKKMQKQQITERRQREKSARGESDCSLYSLLCCCGKRTEYTAIT